MRRSAGLTLLVSFGVLIGLSAYAQTGKAAVVWPAGEIKWIENPAMKGAKLAVLWGDPKTGSYGALKTFAAGSKLALHSHSSDQKVIAVSGVITLTMEGSPARKLTAGSYVFIPGGAMHTAECAPGAECVYFEEQQGPSDIKFAEPTK